MERGTHGDHQFETFRDGGERGGGAPRVQGGRGGAFDVVEVQFGDERQVIADMLAAAGEFADVIPRCFHALVGHVAQPAAKDR